MTPFPVFPLVSKRQGLSTSGGLFPIIYRIDLAALDLGQTLDGLEMRAESWERTGDYLRTEKMPEGEFFIVEECSKPEEADAIAAQYRSIIGKIRSQMEAQR